MPESKPKRRWYHLSPDRLISGLLAAEGFLLLSDRFQWFAFNEKKGYTVLIAMAAACLALAAMLLWFGASLLFRWRFQFSLRTLVMLVVVAAIPCCWLAFKMRQAERRRNVVDTIKDAGGVVHYDCEFAESDAEPPAPAWLRRLVGGDFLVDVTRVEFGAVPNDQTLESIKVLTKLRGLDLRDSQVTDAGLENLRAWPELQSLNLSTTQATDSGIEHVKTLTKLELLVLSCTQVTDAGLENLEGLTQLRHLDLSHTQISGAGLEYLKGLRRLEVVWLIGTRITGPGLEHLQELTGVESLSLWRTEITDAGMEHLKGLTQLKKLDLFGTQVTDSGMEHLKGLTQLEELRLAGTQVTGAGLVHLTGTVIAN